MKNLTKFLFIITMLTSYWCTAQNGLELRYFNPDGFTAGVETNQYTKLDYRKQKHQFSFANTVLPSPVRKQFIDLSYQYHLNFNSIKLIPTISYSTNLRTDDLMISTYYFELPLLYEAKRLILLLKPAYDNNNEVLISATAAFSINEDLFLFGSYGMDQNFTFMEEAIAFGLLRKGKKLNIKSGIQIPKDEERLFVRLLTSFNYSFGSKAKESTDL